MRHAHVISESEQLRNDEMRRAERLFRLLQHIPASPATSCNKVILYSSGPETFEDMFHVIREAKHHVHMEYYIWREDDIGGKLKQLLIEKARQGVEVRIICDGIGSYKLDHQYIQSLKHEGVECHVFLPPTIAFFDKRLNYRNHRKITIVDGQAGYLGGLNIGDEYVGKDLKYGYWRDTHMKIEGDAVYFLQQTFLTDWAFVSGHALFHRSELFPLHDCIGEDQVQIVASGPDQDLDTIVDVFFSVCGTAKRRIYMTSPYFIPDHGIFLALKTAATSGVDVRIIIPQEPDSKLVYLASLSYLEELMQAGVQFYQYTQGFLHAKTLIVDELIAVAGTANMDMRSFYSNFELNALIYNTTTIRELEKQFMLDLQASKRIDPYQFAGRSRMQKGKEVLARLLSPLM